MAQIEVTILTVLGCGIIAGIISMTGIIIFSKIVEIREKYRDDYKQRRAIKKLQKGG